MIIFDKLKIIIMIIIIIIIVIIMVARLERWSG